MTNEIQYAVTAATSRTIVWVCNATSKDEALAKAMASLERTKIPASWSACPVTELPADLKTEALAWKAES